MVELDRFYNYIMESIVVLGVLVVVICPSLYPDIRCWAFRCKTIWYLRLVVMKGFHTKQRLVERRLTQGVARKKVCIMVSIDNKNKKHYTHE